MSLEEKCKYHEGQFNLSSSEDWAKYWVEGNKLQISYDAYSCDSSFSEHIEINFCPMCGEKLT